MTRQKNKNSNFFKKCGKRGGQRRSRLLTPMQRTVIAIQAASYRWRKENKKTAEFESVRVVSADFHDPVYIEEILEHGTIDAWKTLYHHIYDQPFGGVSETLKRVLSASKIYGATNLWKQILECVQGAIL